MTFLVVDDEKPVAEIFARYLQPLSSEPVEIALSMEEAFEKLRGKKYDVITLDLRMPGYEKAKTLSRIKEMRAMNEEGIVIVVTGLSESGLETACLEAGAHGFAFKPAVFHQEGFLHNLMALGKSLLRQPTKYQQNLALAERLIEKTAPLIEAASNGKPCA